MTTKEQREAMLRDAAVLLMPALRGSKDEQVTVARHVRTLVAEVERMEKREKEWADCIEMLAAAAYRLQQLAGGADVPDGDVGFACKDGMFHEQIAHARIKALLKLKDKS